jgi:hypothetical protein
MIAPWKSPPDGGETMWHATSDAPALSPKIVTRDASPPTAAMLRRTCAGRRIASHRIASHRIAAHRSASHRSASHRSASQRIASQAGRNPQAKP